MQTKDLGDLPYFLGIEIAYYSQDIVLSERKYMFDLLSNGFLGACSVGSPMDSTIKLDVEPGESFC